MKKDEKLQVKIAYIAGRFEAQLEGFAGSLGIPMDVLTEGVVAFLQPERERGEMRVSHLSLDSEARNTGSREVEITGHAPSSTPSGRVKRKMTKKQIEAMMEKRRATKQRKKEERQHAEELRMGAEEAA